MSASVAAEVVKQEVIRCVVSACSPEDMSVPVFLLWASVSMSLWMFMVCGVCYAIVWNHLPSQITALGGIVGLLLCQLLKLAIGHEREFPACGVGDAMPSQHAMLAFYFCAYYSWVFYKYDKVSPSAWVVIRIAIAIAYAATVTVSRVQLQAGDSLEAMVGAVLGIAYAMAYTHTLSLVWSGALPNFKKDD